MLFKKYTDFLDSRLNENVQLAKSYMKSRALDKKKERGDKEAELSEDEIKSAENDKNYLAIKDMVKDNPGYTYAFTKFFFEDEIPVDELYKTYLRLKEYRQLLSSQLSMPVHDYGNVKRGADGRTGYEMLTDDLDKIDLDRITKKFVNKLPGEFTVNQGPDAGTVVKSFKREYQNVGAELKEKIAGIAKAFDELGQESNGKKDEKVNQELQDLFFNKIRRYRNLNQVVIAAENFIKNTNNGGISKFFQNIQRTNLKYGDLNGVEIVFDEANIVIVEVKSFQANRELNSNTSHCIASSQSQWDSYVGSDSNYNKQYYIYNFNLSPSDSESIIGITIGPNQNIRACHNKPDNDRSSSIKSMLKEWARSYEIKEDLFSLLQPMTEAEIEAKKKRVIANKKIIMDNLTVEDAKEYISQGADPNAGNGSSGGAGKPLQNALENKNIELVKYLLEQGAIPNLGDCMKKAYNFESLKLMIDHGGEIKEETIKKCIGDIEAIKYILNTGYDPNQDQSVMIRNAANSPDRNLEVIKLIYDKGGDITIKNFIALRFLFDAMYDDENDKMDEVAKSIFDFFCAKIKEDNIPYPDTILDPKVTSSLTFWLNSSSLSNHIEDTNSKVAKEIFDYITKEITETFTK